MTTNKPLDLATLRKVAQAAAHNHTNWKVTTNREDLWPEDEHHRSLIEFCQEFDPPTVLALIDQLEAARVELAKRDAEDDRPNHRWKTDD